MADLIDDNTDLVSTGWEAGALDGIHAGSTTYEWLVGCAPLRFYTRFLFSWHGGLQMAQAPLHHAMPTVFKALRQSEFLLASPTPSMLAGNRVCVVG